MQKLTSRPVLRWLAPLAVVLAVGTSGLVAVTANADPALPDKSVQELLVAVQQAKVDGLSGTVVQEANLGIPDIPGTGGQDSSELSSLISGTHTLKVWYADPDQARLAVLGDLGESDVITNGSDVWTWSSKDNAATHRTLPADRPADRHPTPSGAPTTPEQAAQKFLDAVGPSTTVTPAKNITVGNRDAYEIVLTPKDPASTLISSVRIAIDGEHFVPLRVQVFATGDVKAFEVRYDSIDFTRPDDGNFAFNPPPGAKVTEKATAKAPTDADRQRAEDKATAAKKDSHVVGTAWTSVLVAKVPTGSDAKGGDQLQGYLRQLEPVSGSWGSGRLLRGTAFRAVLTDDGRVAVGAVPEQALYQALEK